MSQESGSGELIAKMEFNLKHSTQRKTNSWDHMTQLGQEVTVKRSSIKESDARVIDCSQL